MIPGNPPPAFPSFPVTLPLGEAAPGSDAHRSEASFLDAVQGNILKGHGRNFQRLVFFHLPADPAERTNFLREITARDMDGRRRWVTSAQEQRAQRDIRHAAVFNRALLEEKSVEFDLPAQAQMRAVITLSETQVFRGVLLTRAGLRQLGITMTGEPAKSFNAGMKTGMGYKSAAPAGASATAMLEDDEMRATPYCYEDTPADFHGMFLLASDTEAELNAEVAALGTWCGHLHAEILPEMEQGITWRDQSNPYGNDYLPPREPFGFADGISQPHFFSDERLGQPMRRNRPTAWAWTDLSLDDVFITDGPHAGGSYVALLKIEQKVATFRAHEQKIAALLQRKFSLAAKTAEYLAPAFLMGRTRQGYPLGEILGRLTKTEAGLRALFPPNPQPPVLHHPPQPGDPVPTPPTLPPWLNEFDFEQRFTLPPDDRTVPATGGCPFHVHLRKMNPRAAADTGSPSKLISAQPVRRGATFDPDGLLAKRERGEITEWPDEGVGLLFLAYMSNVDRQFEQAHSQWAPDAAFPGPEPGAPDPVLAPPDPAAPMMAGRLAMPPMPRILKRLGGVYLFAPSIPWLARGGQ
jgi:deferrochelatase/peroxidase EfeB